VLEQRFDLLRDFLADALDLVQRSSAALAKNIGERTPVRGDVLACRAIGADGERVLRPLNLKSIHYRLSLSTIDFPTRSACATTVRAGFMAEEDGKNPASTT